MIIHCSRALHDIWSEDEVLSYGQGVLEPDNKYRRQLIDQVA